MGRALLNAQISSGRQAGQGNVSREQAVEYPLLIHDIPLQYSCRLNSAVSGGVSRVSSQAQIQYKPSLYTCRTVRVDVLLLCVRYFK